MKETIEKIKILNRYQKKIAQVTEDQFNIFKICGVNHYANTHSAILSEILTSTGSHNLKNKFLDAFVATLKSQKIVADDFYFDSVDAQIFTEYQVGQNGRIDIMIKNSNQCIIVENKIYAADQFEQLKRYETFARNTFSSYLLLYLTLWGDEASEESARDAICMQLSYQTFIIPWLERCIEISARKPIIRETLIQYQNHLRNLTTSNTNTEMNNEIVSLLSQEENLEALFTIGENFTAARNHLINKVFLPQLSQICSELDLVNESEEYDRVNIPWSGFLVGNTNWKYFRIGFEFEGKGPRHLISGLVHKDVNIRNDESFDALKPKFNKSNERWLWSSFSPFVNWEKDAMVAIANGQMAQHFKNEIEKILRFTEGLDM